MECLSRNFHQLPWSRWHLPEKLSRGDSGPQSGPQGVPRRPGTYRIRLRGFGFLAYVGESSNLADRLVGHWSDVNDTGKVEARSRSQQFQHLVEKKLLVRSPYEVSWAAAPGPHPYDLSSKREREALERCLGWLCRKETGRSPFGNYARAGIGNQLLSDVMPDGTPVTVRAAGFMHRGAAALRSKGRPPGDRRWMGRLWSKPVSHGQLSQGGPDRPTGPLLSRSRRGPGLYKILGGSGKLMEVGYRSHIGQDLAGILNRLPKSYRGSWSPLRRKTLKLEALELVGDLIGAFYHESGSVPARQFDSAAGG